MFLVRKVIRAGSFWIAALTKESIAFIMFEYCRIHIETENGD